MNTVAQIIGFAGILMNAVIYQQKERRHLLFCKLASDGIWMLHYLLLGAYAGAAIAVIACVRETVFLFEKHTWADKKYWAPVFILLNVVFAVLTWKGPVSLLPACASVTGVLSFAQAKPRLTRVLCFPISGCMLTYDLMVGSYAGLANELFTLCSTVIGICRHDIHRKKGEKTV